jgi:phosphoribosylformylglycinamidine synthase
MENLYSEIEVTKDVAVGLGLTENEWNQILEIMGRTPTYTEIGMYSVLWSEHCSYKNSIKQIKTLPRKGKMLLVEAGKENAGMVDMGGGYGIVFKIESHNSPSAVDPFQGAATGVGGILRDIFTMGARPIAALNSLRFGELTVGDISDSANSNKNNERTKYLLRGVVAGIGHYGNAFGVPTVGGEIYFDDCYQGNPLVNAMAVGIVDVKKTATSAASGVGNPVIIFGSSTGKDGIHAASLLASRTYDGQKVEVLPTVPQGDPFAEKLLLEATLEMIEAGIIVGIQDMGAAGISCSTCEMSAKNGVGMNINLDKVPLREAGMSGYEIMLSESQERMLAVIEKGKEEIAHNICKKWGVNSANIGEITSDGNVNLWREGKHIAQLKAEPLVLGGGAPQNDREFSEPKYLNETRKFDTEKYAKMPATENDFWKILTSPTVASKRWIFEQYDSQVRTNTVAIKGDAGVIRIKELPGKGIAVSTDCNSRYAYLNPYRGGMSAVCESARNVACVGARPVAITNNLNFGNPYNPEIYWTFREAIRGIGDACRVLDTPVTGGNVSFHNERSGKPIFPTPVIGMLGIIEDLDKVMSSDFKNIGDEIYLLGNNRSEVGGSEYLKIIHNIISGEAPEINVNDEKILIDTILELIDKKIINSAHDISEGGIAICLAEKSINSRSLGCTVSLKNSTVGSIFGESQSRIIITVSKNSSTDFIDLCNKNNLFFEKLGEVIENNFIIEGVVSTTVSELSKQYEKVIPNIMNGDEK